VATIHKHSLVCIGAGTPGQVALGPRKAPALEERHPGSGWLHDDVVRMLKWPDDPTPSFQAKSHEATRDEHSQVPRNPATLVCHGFWTSLACSRDSRVWSGEVRWLGTWRSVPRAQPTTEGGGGAGTGKEARVGKGGGGESFGKPSVTSAAIRGVRTLSGKSRQRELN
jgi:hypothetical protein